MHSIINKPVEIWSGAVPRFEKCYGHGHSGLPREPAPGYGPLAADSRQLEHEVDWTTVPHIIDVKNVWSWNSIKKFEKHFWSHRNELIGLDFVLKVAGCRAVVYPSHTDNTLCSAYSDTAAVTSCSWQIQHVKSWLQPLSSSSYTAPMVEQIRANFYIQRL